MSVTYIGDLDVSCRFRTTCRNEGIDTLEQLASMSEREIMLIPNCGIVTLREMRDFVARHNLQFVGGKWYSGCHNYNERKESKAMAKRKIIQIVMGERDDVDNTEVYDANGFVIGGTTREVKRNTLFALTDDGKIWTRAYRDDRYQEWFTIHTKDITGDS